MKKAILPGSYDPITNGHLDIIKRASEIFDNIIILIANNSEKKYMLSPENRILLVKDAVKFIPNACVDYTDGMLVDYVANHSFPVIVKGIRNENDFLYEKNMAEFNTKFSLEKYGFRTDTIFLISDLESAGISSTKVRDLIANGDNYSDIVPNHELLASLVG